MLETVEHVLFVCDKYDIFHKSLVENIKSKSLRVEDIWGKTDAHGYRTLFTFLHETGLDSRIWCNAWIGTMWGSGKGWRS